MSEDVLEEVEDGVLFRVKVNPNSQKFSIGEVNQWRNHLEVNLSSEPKRGEANRELIEELENKLDNEVRLVRGKKSREKQLIVKNVSRDDVIQKLCLE